MPVEVSDRIIRAPYNEPLTYLFFSSLFICSATSVLALLGTVLSELLPFNPTAAESFDFVELFFSAEAGWRIKGETAMMDVVMAS